LANLIAKATEAAELLERVEADRQTADDRTDAGMLANDLESAALRARTVFL
jgi:hypothetical protein